MSNASMGVVSFFPLLRRYSPQRRIIEPATHTLYARRARRGVARCGWAGSASRRTSRSGATLIEAVSAVTLASLIAGIGAVLLGQMLRGEVRAREHIHRLTALGRLSAHLREDAGQAAQVVLPQDDKAGIEPRQGADVSVLAFVLQSGAQVEYVARPDGLHRVARGIGSVRRERYSLASGWSCSVQVEEQQKIHWLVLTLRTPPAAGEAWECAIEALLAAPRKQHTAEGLP